MASPMQHTRLDMASVCYNVPGMVQRMRESRLVAGKKDSQLVLRLPQELLEALKAHQAELQAARPFESVSLAAATRDLLAQAFAKKKKRR